MKKLLFLICACVACTQGAYAQAHDDEEVPSYFILGPSLTNNARLGLTGLVAFPALHRLGIGVFISFDIAVFDPKVAAGKNEARQTLEYGSAGILFFGETFRVGAGFESQTYKPPVYVPGNQLPSTKGIRCVRVITGLSLEKHSAMFSCNVWAKEFHYTGYWNAAFTEETSLGIYANSATIGIGLMIRKHTLWASDLMNANAGIMGSVGYNPRTGQSGISIFLAID